MRSEPLGQWMCDDCKDLIHYVDDGHLEWLVDEVTYKQYGFGLFITRPARHGSKL